MYEELIKRLRGKGCQICPICREAADAIEEMDMLLDGVSADNEALCETIERMKKPRWIPVTERLPSDFVSVQAHMTDAGDFPSVREAYVVDEGWFFPSLKEFHPVDMWKQFDEPPKEET